MPSLERKGAGKYRGFHPWLLEPDQSEHEVILTAAIGLAQHERDRRRATSVISQALSKSLQSLPHPSEELIRLVEELRQEAKESTTALADAEAKQLLVLALLRYSFTPDEIIRAVNDTSRSDQNA